MVDSIYGIELEFYRQKPVAMLFRLWKIFFLIALAIFIAFIVTTVVGGNSVFIIAGVIIMFNINLPFVIPLAIYLIKWLWRKK